MTLLVDFIQQCWTILQQVAPWLLLGAVVAGCLHAFLPPDFLSRNLRGKFGVVRSVLIGIPLPLCSCSVIPVGLGLRTSNATRGAVVGFLTATPQTGVDSVLVSASMLGWPFAFFKLVTALVTGLVGGWVTESLAPSPPTLPMHIPDSNPQRQRWYVEVTSHAIEMIRSIWLWLIIGVLVSAVISEAIPNDWSHSFQDIHPLLGMLVALTLSLPLYVCATASVPIAAAMVASGLPTGAAIVFLMAGPATNIATMGSIYKTLGRSVFLIYLATILVGSLMAGLLFEWMIPQLPSPTSLDHHHNHDASGWLTNGSTIALVGMFLFFAWQQFLAPLFKRHDNHVVSEEDGPQHHIPVEGMHCQACVSKLTKSLRAVVGVSRVDVALDPGSATVFGTASEQTIRNAILSAGFMPLDSAGTTENGA